MKKHNGICTGCSTGCSVTVEENQDTVYRLKPRENPHVNQWWMCDEGRYGYHHVHSDKRLTNVERRDGAKWTLLEWSQVVREIDERFQSIGRVAVVLSPHLTVEEAYLLGKYARSIDPQAIVALGPVPVEGTDETFKNGFTIRAEKCPNKRGVEEVVTHFMGQVTPLESVLAAVEGEQPIAVWVSGGYKHGWIDAATAEQLAGAACLVVHDLFDSPLAEKATYRLPEGAFAEREGSYVNVDERLQSVVWAIRPPAGVRVAASVYWELLGEQGLVKPRRVLDEIADRIAFFTAAKQPVGPLGVDLKAPVLEEATS
jgi:NADH-quinone oxidoreductase subunit G